MANFSQLSNAELFNYDSPVRPDYLNFASRFETFNNWPHENPSPEKLAEAGLYFCGEKEKNKCFYCNGGLHNWSPSDDPWHDHARWYPTCTFLLRCKGVDYVHSVNSENPHQFWSLSRKLQLPIPTGFLLTRFILLCVYCWLLVLV